MTIDTKQLRDLAEKATPGVRHTGNGEHYAREVRTVSRAIAWCGHYPTSTAHDDAAFIAACSPDIILALLDEVERLDDAIGEMRK